MTEGVPRIPDSDFGRLPRARSRVFVMNQSTGENSFGSRATIAPPSSWCRVLPVANVLQRQEWYGEPYRIGEMFCITALDKKIVGRWNAIDNFFGAV